MGLERRQEDGGTGSLAEGSERERREGRPRGVGNGALHLLAQTEGGRVVLVVQDVQGSGESWKRNLNGLTLTATFPSRETADGSLID